MWRRTGGIGASSGSAPLGRPLEQRSNGPPELPRKATLRGVSLARVVDVEADRVGGARLVNELVGAERPDARDPGLHGVEALVEKVSRDPGGSDVVTGHRLPVPERVRVDRVESVVA